jgi:gas vesicle protein
MSQDTSGGTIFMAFVLGAIAGAATALLLAPQSGEETRHLLADKAREGKDKASEAAAKGREFLHHQAETLNQAIERGKEAYQRARGAEEQA